MKLPSEIKYSIVRHFTPNAPNLVHFVKDQPQVHIMDRIDSVDKLRTLLKQIACEQGFIDYYIKIKPMSSDGANYATILFKAQIEEENPGVLENSDVLNLFIKVAAMGEKVRDSCDIKIYDLEQYAYTTLKKIFGEIEDRHDVAEEDRLVMPTYYGANTTPREEMLVLEDLSLEGFTMQDRFQSIDWSFAASAVRELAKFHALAMAFEKEYPDEFQKFLIRFRCVWITQETFELFWKDGFKKAVEIAAEEHKDVVRKYFEAATLETVLKMNEPVRKRVLTHADFRPSNLLHRKREDGRIEVIPVDYQTLQAGCVGWDLIMLIMTGTDEQFRRQHFDQLVEHYYSQLKAAMTRLGLPETEYTRDDFDFEMKEKLPYGLMLAAAALPIVTVEAEHAPSLDNGLQATSFSNVKTSSVYPDRMNGIIKDYVRWGLLE